MKKVCLTMSLLIALFSCDLFEEENNSKDDASPDYVGSWVYNSVNFEDSQDSVTYTWTLNETSGTILESETEDGITDEVEYLIDIENIDTKLKITKTRYKSSTDTTYSDYTEDDAEMTFDYTADKNNILFYIDDEEDANTGMIFTIDGYTDDDYNDGQSIIGRWGWSSSDMDFNTDGDFIVYDTSTTPETIQYTFTYTFANNILSYAGETASIYLFDDIQVQDYGYGNTIYIYKKRN